jgi:hypothetical protein
MKASPQTQHLLAAEYAGYWWFLALWILAPVAPIAMGLAWSRANANEQSGGARGAATAGSAGRGTWIAGVAFVLFVCAYAFLTFYHEDLIGLDYAQLTARPFVGMPIWPESGRFFPLALQEYNFLSLLKRSAAVYHAFSVVELVVVLLCIDHITAEMPRPLRWFVMAVVMTLPSVAYSFFGLIVPERDMLFWIAVWIVCLRSWSRNHGVASICGALAAAQFILYYKETAFLLVGGFAAARLLLSLWREGRLPARGQRGAFAKSHAMELGHLLLCAVFLAIYVVAIVPHIQASYSTSAGGVKAVVSTLSSYARSDLLLDAFVVALAWRVMTLVGARRRVDLLWEPLALGALAYALAYVKLGMVRDYYMAPADFIAALYVARVAYESLRVERRVVVGTVLVLGWLALAWNVSDAARYLLVRKQYVDANVQLVNVVKEYASSHAASPVTLFFPQIGGFQVMEFAAFLRYKGLPVATDTVAGGAAVVLESPHRFPGDRCHPSQDFRCAYAATPQPGDLIVYLPGREVPQPELDALAGAQALLRYHPADTRVERVLRALVPAGRMADQPADAYLFRR